MASDASLVAGHEEGGHSESGLIQNRSYWGHFREGESYLTVFLGRKPRTLLWPNRTYRCHRSRTISQTYPVWHNVVLGFCPWPVFLPARPCNSTPTLVNIHHNVTCVAAIQNIGGLGPKVRKMDSEGGSYVSLP